MPQLRISRVFTLTPSKYLYGIVFKYRNSFAFTFVESTIGVTGILHQQLFRGLLANKTPVSAFSLPSFDESNYVSTVSRGFFDLSRQAVCPH